MHDKELYARILNIEPWRVADVELNEQEGEVVVQVESAGSNSPSCAQLKRPADRPRVGLQGTCDDAVGVPHARVGA